MARESFQCPLCGKTAAHGQPACGTCPLHDGCDLVCCPRCGYTIPVSSRIERWFRRLLGRAKEAE